MSPATLERKYSPDGVDFALLDRDRVCLVDTWANHDIASPSGNLVNIAPLLAHLNAGDAETDRKRLLVPWAVVADWSPAQLRSLDLPGPYQHGVQLDRRGLVHEPDFAVSYRFIRLSGQPFTSARRTGAIVRIASKEYTLLSPLYEAVRSIDEWNEKGRRSQDPLAAAGVLLDSLGDLGATIRRDSYLQSIRITSATGFSLRPYLNKNGSADFDPVLARPCHVRTGRASEEIDEDVGFDAALPEAKEEEFAGQFRSFNDVRTRYALGDGWLVVVPPVVQKALRVAKSRQQSSPTVRREFIRNPHAALRHELESDLSEGELEALFWESGEYAQRVRDIGLRIPKVVPFVVRPSQPWLRPEQAGLEIDGTRVVLDGPRAAELTTLLTDAMVEGNTEVVFEGQSVPVNEDSVRAARQVAEALGSYSTSEKAEEAAGDLSEGPETPLDQVEEQLAGPIALLVDDNLETVTFQATPRARGDFGFGKPAQLGAQLFPHQEQGLVWLEEAWAAGLPGVLLADDMGLGKTLQVLAFLGWIREFQPNDTRPILIVAPTGLIRNWMREAEVHLESPRGPVKLTTGGLGAPTAATGSGLRDLRLTDAARGKETDGGLPVLDVQRLREAPWVLTSYESLRDYQHSFGRVDWSVLVLDEVQKIKNPIALATDAVKAMNADFRIALTGTPVENHIADLWSIVDAIFPGRLGALREFVSQHQQPEDLQRLHKDLLEGQPPTLMLRRMKEDHLRGLPDIIRHTDEGHRTMPPLQVAAYDDVVRTIRESSGKGFMMVALQKLRQVSVHPDPLSTDTLEDYIRASAKLSYMFEVLDRVHDASEKALVFLDSLDVQGAISGLIQERYRLPRIPMILNGSVSGGKRSSMVQSFQSEPDQFDVMILSPKAGGVGLTLTEANHVIHLMRWWNPAVEDQATDRAYRIGQRRPVHVYLPAAVHPEQGEYSFDIRLHELLERKRGLSRSLLAPDSFTDDDMETLYKETTGTASQ